MTTYLLIAFAWSWVAWIIGIKLHVRQELLLIGTAGPLIAAVWMWCAGSRLSEALRTIVRQIRWPGWRWPLIATLSMPAFLLIPAGIAHLAGLPLVHPARGGAVLMFVRQFLAPGLLEEPGWRGWLLPYLQQRRSPLTASLIVWLPWALWHAPLDFTGGVGSNWVTYVQVRVVYFIAITVLLTWLYNRSGGSVLVTALFHAGFNTFPFVLPYCPPFLALIFVWAIWVVVSDRMWRSPRAGQATAAGATIASYHVSKF
jgi:membrane protease YdiL (CAAX protease family)